MSKKKKRQQRDAPTSTFIQFLQGDGFDDLCGYTKLSDNPEVISAVNKIAELVSSMTIYQMENTERGDVRIVDGLSRKVDIEPNAFQTRKTFVGSIVRNLLLEGNGNAFVLPTYSEGYLDQLIVLPAAQVSLIPELTTYGYYMSYRGRNYTRETMVHFVDNPDPNYPWKGEGYRVALKDITGNLKQAAKTKKGFMSSKYNPSVIIKVDGLVDEFSSKKGRDKLLKDYIEQDEAGKPWVIPADAIDVKEIKPLTLNDLAISDSVQIDKRTVASILGVPAFVVGIGSFNSEEWNNFISTKIKHIADVIAQELTRALLISPNRYFKFNARSLYAYDIQKLSNVGNDNYTRGIMTGNEVRDWLDLSPREGLDELVILENYIPAGSIADQKKLVQKEGGE